MAPAGKGNAILDNTIPNKPRKKAAQKPSKSSKSSAAPAKTFEMTDIDAEAKKDFVFNCPHFDGKKTVPYVKVMEKGKKIGKIRKNLVDNLKAEGII